MANFNKIKLILIAFISFIFSSCSNKIDSDYIKKNGKKIKTIFNSVVISKRNDSFLIEDKNFSPSKFIELTKKGNCYNILKPLDLRENEKKDYLYMIYLLDSLGFQATTCENSNFGIDIKLYGDKANLIYCSQINSVRDKQWKDYILSLRRIENNWYIEDN